MDQRILFRAVFEEKVLILKYLARIFDKKIIKIAYNILLIFLFSPIKINNTFKKN